MASFSKPKVAVGKTLWGTTSDGVLVYRVNGRAVRDKHNVDFTEGGHHYRWSFIPVNEVWIEKMKDAGEEEFNLLHELHERHLMKDKGMAYEKAHDQTNPVEVATRKNPVGLAAALKKEGWNGSVQ